MDTHAIFEEEEQEWGGRGEEEEGGMGETTQSRSSHFPCLPFNPCAILQVRNYVHFINT